MPKVSANDMLVLIGFSTVRIFNACCKKAESGMDCVLKDNIIAQMLHLKVFGEVMEKDVFGRKLKRDESPKFSNKLEE